MSDTGTQWTLRLSSILLNLSLEDLASGISYSSRQDVHCDTIKSVSWDRREERVTMSKYVAFSGFYFGDISICFILISRAQLYVFFSSPIFIILFSHSLSLTHKHAHKPETSRSSGFFFTGGAPFPCNALALLTLGKAFIIPWRGSILSLERRAPVACDTKQNYE